MKNYTLLLLALSSLFSTLNAQELNVPAGKQFSYVTHVKGKANHYYDMKYTYRFKSLGKDSDGNQVFECELTNALEMNSRDVSKKDIDTDDLKNVDFSSSGVVDKLALIKHPLKLTFSSKGKLLKLEGYDKMLEERDRDWKLNTGIKNQLASRHSYLSYQFQKMFFQFPEQPIGPSGEWKEKDGRSYKIKVIDQKLQPLKNINSEVQTSAIKNDKGNSHRLIEVSYTSSGYIKESGKHVIDAETGLIQNSEGKRSFENVLASERWVTNDDFSQKIGKNIKEINHDTAWINMAVRTSNWSDAFKTDGEYDQQKMLTYFKYKDALFGIDSHYNTRKLSLLQQLGREGKDSLYNKALLATPTKYLKGFGGTIHTANKVYVLAETDPVGAHLAARDASKLELFDDYLNNASVSQTFLSPYGKYGSDKDRYLQMLKLMAEDKDPVLRSKSRPLYNWAKASTQPEDSKLILLAANELRALNIENMKLGNGGRYSLLIYNMLKKLELNAEAQQLLDATISKLNITSADSLYKKKTEDKNILAHAYYLKYKAAQEAKTPDAMRYLSLAAQKSPADPKEKTTNMFYDRHFLKSKESYREEFLKELSNSGSKPELLEAFAAHVSAEPESLRDMQQLYKKRFPDDDFAATLFTEVVNKWDKAPDFKLKDHLDKQFFTMNDYAGKWMVVDFWGTWCGPCVGESPAINDFDKELRENKYPDAAFLSIACQDFPQTVQAFMTKNNYDFKVLMSDGKIQKKYKLDGYPYKVLVSPNGRMIALQRGKNWQEILKNFSVMKYVD